MDTAAVLIVVLVALVVLGLPILALILALIALNRSSRLANLERRIAALESQLPSLSPSPRAVPPPAPAAAAFLEAQPIAAEIVPAAEAFGPASAIQTVQWEMLIGQKALGWIAVVLAIFAAAFFLRYAYENNWVGPQGRVAIGEAIGVIMMLAGLRYYLRRWPAFSQMLSACGIVVLYLATYSAFGFYRLLPHEQAGGFLAAIIALSLVAAILYDSAGIAVVAVLGAFLTPVLLSSEQDTYQALFVYLAIVNLGVGLVTVLRGWPGLGSLALALTQLLFWAWYVENYHPEKFGWAIGFQAAVYCVYLAQDLGIQFRRLAGARWETSLRMIANAAFWFAACYTLLRPDYRAWMGSAALVMATVYALIARQLLGFHGRYNTELLTAVSLSIGFLALAIPLEAEARWVALGWSACAASLWWLSVRVRAGSLRILAAAMAALSVARLLSVDLDAYPDRLVWPILNPVALPALGVTAFLLAAIVTTRSYFLRSSRVQQQLLSAAAMLLLVVLWIVLSVDLHRYFYMQARLDISGTLDWRRLGQMSLSVLWTVYAATLLAIGFRWRLAGLRWLAIGFFAATVAKVFLLDMAGLMQLYRIIAFLVLAIFLGIAARVYQVLGRRTAIGTGEEAAVHAQP